MFWFSDGGLIEAVGECARGRKPYWWYRDVLLQAQDRRILRIVGHSEERPFWWRPFSEAVQVTSERLEEELRV